MFDAVPVGALARARNDPRWAYRPMLDLIGLAEGTDPVGKNPSTARGYNETLGYGAFTDGPVALVSMTLDQVDALQTRMLRHPQNGHNSSAAGRYQIVRTTLRSIRQRLRLSGKAKFNAAMQDRLACFLLGLRGIDRWLAGRMTENALINELAQEWASFPTTDGTGHYSGQHSRVTLSQVRQALADVSANHQVLMTAPNVPDVAPAPPMSETAPFGDVTLDGVLQVAARWTSEDLDKAAQTIALAQAVQRGWHVTEGAETVPHIPLQGGRTGAIITNPAKEVPAMTGSKPFFKSKTIWGLAVAAISMWSPAVGGVLTALGLGGSEIDPSIVTDVKTAIEQIVAAVGLIMAAWGRFDANSRVTLSGK